jgi:hypothetical protein
MSIWAMPVRRLLMRPTEPDIAWALANRDLVARWLERRGGWQRFDLAYHTNPTGESCGACCFLTDELTDDDAVAVYRHDGLAFHIVLKEELLWLPGADDVLEMLENVGQHEVNIFKTIWREGRPASENYAASVFVSGQGIVRGYGDTRLIALCELLKAVENE